MKRQHTNARTSFPALALALALGVVLAACGGSSGGGDGGGQSLSAPRLDMGLPESLTGGSTSTATASDAGSLRAGPQCDFNGAGSGDPFRNGYRMTQFLVSMAAAQTCLADFLMNEVTQLGAPTDGTLVALPSGDAGSPSHLSITTDTATQTTIRLYWDGNTTTPAMFLSWNEGSAATEGRLIATAAAMGGSTDPGAPDRMRLDFTYTDTEQKVNLYFAFPSTNPHMVSGFHIRVSKALDGSTPTYVALGRMDMSGQPMAAFDSNITNHISAAPTMLVFTISDADGQGAAIASFTDLGLGFDLGADGHLGYYLHTKTDKYFFTGGGASEWIDKALNSASLAGGKTTNSTVDGSVESALGLSAGTIGTCATASPNPDAACNALLSAIFADSNYVTEPESGSDPGDARSTVINSVTASDYLQSPYPPGFSSWSGVFEMSFTPSS